MVCSVDGTWWLRWLRMTSAVSKSWWMSFCTVGETVAENSASWRPGGQAAAIFVTMVALVSFSNDVPAQNSTAPSIVIDEPTTA